MYQCIFIMYNGCEQVASFVSLIGWHAYLFCRCLFRININNYGLYCDYIKTTVGLKKNHLYKYVYIYSHGLSVINVENKAIYFCKKSSCFKNKSYTYLAPYK